MNKIKYDWFKNLIWRYAESGSYFLDNKIYLIELDKLHLKANNFCFQGGAIK